MRKTIFNTFIMLFAVCAVIMIGSVKVQAASGNCGDNIIWTLNEETWELVLTGSGEMENLSEYPWEEYEDSIKSVVVGDGITTIGDSAFTDFPELVKATLPEGLTSIGDHAFSYSSLTDITIPDGVKSIGYEAFGLSKLRSVRLPEGLLSIADNAFCWCEELESVDIPDSVTSIGANAFGGCSSIKEIIIPDGITLIDRHTFAYCDSLVNVVIPDSVTCIEEMAFDSCSSLKEITLPDGITEIGSHAFSRCENLTEVTIPDGVTWLGGSVFRECVTLRKVVLPDSIETIHYYTFAGCKMLTEIQLPGSLTEIMPSLFRECERLTHIVIPENIEIINVDAFIDCKNLAVVTIDSPQIAQALISADACGYLMTNAKTINVKSSISDVPDLTAYGFTNVATVTIDGVEYTEYSNHIHADNNGDGTCDICVPDVFVFDDVSLDDYYGSSVYWALDKGITAGMTDNMFVPGGLCTREQLVTFFWRASGSPEANYSGEKFTDVEPGSYYYDAVYWAVKNGIVYGYGDGTFGTGDLVTRGQAVTFLWRKYGSKETSYENPFLDVPEDTYYHDAVLWAVEREITAGSSKEYFDPDFTCTRGQAVTFMHRCGYWWAVVFPG